MFGLQKKERNLDIKLWIEFLWNIYCRLEITQFRYISLVFLPLLDNLEWFRKRHISMDVNWQKIHICICQILKVCCHIFLAKKPFEWE